MNDSIRLLQEFGFIEHGTKTGRYGTELVLVRDMTLSFDAAAPALTFPYFSIKYAGLYRARSGRNTTPTFFPTAF